MRYMNFGCGPVMPDGWVNVDRERHGMNQVVADVLEGLPFPDASFDGIFANHSIQQIGWHDLPKALAELYRVLKPGGVLRISVPDIIGAFEARQASNMSWFPNADGDVDEAFCSYLTWYGTNITPLTAPLLFKLLTEACFRPGIITAGWTYGDDKLLELEDRVGESIFMEGYKPA